MSEKQTNRKEFEQWAAKEGFRMTRRGDGEYVAPFTAIAWRAWQEAVKGAAMVNMSRLLLRSHGERGKRQ